MKRNILFTAILFYCALTINAQKDTLFFIKDGLIVNKQSIKTTDLDSAIFYKPLVGLDIDIETVNIPAVTLASLGSKVTEVGRRDDETPHRATLSAFAMSKYETTNAQYATFLNAKKIGADGLYAKGAYPTEVLIKESSGEFDWGLHYTDGKWVPVAGYENHPVINVSWFGATEFATYVGGFLPTEAEWEYACRGGFNIPVPFYTFDCLSNEDANYFWLYPYSTCTNTITERPGTTLPVGSYAPNEFGLYDMHGNVDEWCSDWYGAYAASSTDPLGALTGDSRVFRGGSWGTKAVNCRSASRDKYSPATINISIGFRVVFYESKASLGDGFVDSRDGNVYPTVTIGNQVWMAENLKYLPQVVGPATASETAPYNYVYDYNGTDVNAAKATENYSDYGVLYNWQAATEACPTGWHLPSDDEWRELTDFIGEGAGGKLKERREAHWTIPNTGATNEYGFTALPGGDLTSSFKNINKNGGWWTSTTTTPTTAKLKAMSSDDKNVLTISSAQKKAGASVRCIRDEKPAFSVGNGVTDADGNEYATVFMFGQEWMAENLKTTSYSNGNSISEGPEEYWEFTTPESYGPAYCWYNNDEAANKDTYGALYNWFVISNDDICPTNWHVPTIAEWTELIDNLGGEEIAGGKLKEAGFTHWLNPNEGATNESGFTGLPAGKVYNDGGFGSLGSSLSMWSIDNTGVDYATYFSLYEETSKIWKEDEHKGDGVSVRCVKNKD